MEKTNTFKFIKFYKLKSINFGVSSSIYMHCEKRLFRKGESFFN